MSAAVDATAHSGGVDRPRRPVAARPPTLPLWRNELVLGAISLAALIVVWEFTSDEQVINPLFFSSPSAIVQAFVRLFVVSRDIYPPLVASGTVGVIGLVASIAVGIPLGCAIGRYRLARGLVEPYVVALYSTPREALVPLLILIFGLGVLPKVVLVFLGAVFPLILNSPAGVEQADRGLIEMARSFRASERQILMRIVLPGALPYMVAGIRLAIGRALIMIVVAELFASNVGIGFFISRMSAQFRTADMFVGVLSLTFAGVLLTALVRRLEGRIAPWREPDAG